MLTPVNPFDRSLGEVEALIQTIYDTEAIYLGSSCEAYSELFGNSEWAWSNGGFILDFDDFIIGFPHQELMCPSYISAYNYDNDGRCLLR